MHRLFLVRPGSGTSASRTAEKVKPPEGGAYTRVARGLGQILDHGHRYRRRGRFDLAQPTLGGGQASGQAPGLALVAMAAVATTGQRTTGTGPGRWPASHHRGHERRAVPEAVDSWTESTASKST